MNKLFFVLIVLFSTNSIAQVSRNFNKSIKPLYELGGGFAYFCVPNYPGSKNNTFRLFPFPVAIYRGKLFRADEDGTRARLINSESLELGFSGGFNFPVKASDNEVREGMPDTEALVGLGPGLIFKIHKSTTQKLNAGLGLRANLEMGRFPSIVERGFLLEPYLRFWHKPSADGPITLFTSISFAIADQKYNDFFYGVEARYKTADREAYSSKVGIVDIAGSLGLTYDYNNKISLFLGAVYSNLTWAANKESPLVENQHNYIAVFGLTWLFAESEIMVQ